MPNPTNALLSSIVEDGKSLAISLNEARRTLPTNKERLNQIHDNVSTAISNILNKLQHVQPLPAFFPENAIPKILDKILDTLSKFKDIDKHHASGYDKLVKRITDDCRPRWQTSADDRSPSSPLVESSNSDSAQIQASTAEEGYPTEEQFNSLRPEEKKCLFSFCLFPAGEEVKKREPIHLWVAMRLIDDDDDDDDDYDDDDDDRVSSSKMLENLVEKGYIACTIQKKKLGKRYKMNQHVRLMVMKEMGVDSKNMAGLSIMDQRQEQPSRPLQKQPSKISKKHEDVNGSLGTLVLNISEDRLQATTFEHLSKTKDNIKVLHLGSWLHSSDSDRYIVMEVEALRGLSKHTDEVTFLSLEGISGIVELPDSVYKLERLKVLDLRGCPNLESLSEGIDSLKALTRLDLSKCYLLDRIPKGIALLTELRVLKGFVINPEVDPQVGNGDGIGKKKASNTSYSCASFSDLSVLKKLVKLTIRTRRKNFPTSDDFETLSAMKRLTTLRVAWVRNSTDDPITSDPGSFPTSLKKLELQAAPNNTMLHLFELISTDPQTSLEKLYIRGGRLRDLGLEIQIFRHVQIVRLRYLNDLHIDWEEFRKFFPNISRLEVLGCRNLVFLPYGENGVWERPSQ